MSENMSRASKATSRPCSRTPSVARASWRAGILPWVLVVSACDGSSERDVTTDEDTELADVPTDPVDATTEPDAVPDVVLDSSPDTPPADVDVAPDRDEPPPAPVAEAFARTCYPAAGGVTIEMQGRGFRAPATVRVGDDVWNADVVDPFTLRFELPVPPPEPGVYPVTVYHVAPDDAETQTPSAASVDLHLHADYAWTATTLRFDGTQGVIGLATGDVDGDGRSDVIISREFDIVVHRAFDEGTGSFGEVAVMTPCSRPMNLAASDLDGDGRADLVLDCGDTLVVMEGREGDLPEVTLTVDSDRLETEYARTMHLVDVDLDGVMDLVLRREGNTTFDIHRGVATGGFDPPVRIAGGAGVTSFALFDVTGDGQPEIVGSVYNRGELVVLAGQSGLAFDEPLAFPLEGVQAIARGPANDEGGYDILIGSESPSNGASIYRWIDDAPALVTRLIGGGLTVTAGLRYAEGASLGVAVTTTPGFRVYLSEPGEPWRCSVPVTTSDGPTMVAVGDLNGDGVDDLVGVRAAVSNLWLLVSSRRP